MICHDKTGYPINQNDLIRHCAHVGRVINLSDTFVTMISLDGKRTARNCKPCNVKVVPTPHWSRWQLAAYRKYRRKAKAFQKRMYRQRLREIKPLFKKYNQQARAGRYKTHDGYVARTDWQEWKADCYGVIVQAIADKHSTI